MEERVCFAYDLEGWSPWWHERQSIREKHSGRSRKLASIIFTLTQDLEVGGGHRNQVKV